MKTLTSPNLTSKQWIKRLKKNNYHVGSYAKELLLSKEFKATKNSYDIVILKGEEMGKDSFTTQEVREKGKSLGYITPPAELAPLLRESISDEEIKDLGLWWLIVMHEPITDSDGFPHLLGVDRCGDGRWLGAFSGRSDDRWIRESGFVFLVPQGPQSLKSSASESLPLESEFLSRAEFNAFKKRLVEGMSWAISDLPK